MTRPFALIVTLALAGCAGSMQENRVPTGTTTTTAVIAVGLDARDAPRVGSAPPETFTDDQVLAILSAYNKGEVNLTKLAHARSKDPRVLSLAKLFAEDHAKALAQETRLADQLVMKPATSEKMREVERTAASDAAKLEGLSGADFDIGFVGNQADRERDALAVLDVQLIPSARVPDVRAHLADFRDRVDHHLRDADELKRTLGGPILAKR